MYYSETDTAAMARTSNLNEELGQVSSSSSSVLLAAEKETDVLNKDFIFYKIPDTNPIFCLFFR